MNILQAPIIILEGTDGTGKTTLARKLEEQHGFEYHHADRPEWDDAFDEYIGPFALGEYNYSTPHVLDRWHLGEAVWPFIFGRDTIYRDAKEVLSVHKSLADRGAVTLVLVRPELDIVDELRARGESETAIANSILGQRTYFDLISRGTFENLIVCGLHTAERLVEYTPELYESVDEYP